MKLFPESALVQLEFDKIKGLLKEQCDSEYGKSRAEELRIHTRKEYIDHELKQTDEFKQLIESSQYFPTDYILNLTRELKLLGIQGAVLNNPDYRTNVFENTQGFLIELSPSAKALKEFFKNINIFVARKDYTVTRLELHEQSGDKTVITYQNKELNTNLPDALFTVQ